MSSKAKNAQAAEAAQALKPPGLKGLNPVPNVAGVCVRCGQRHPSCCGLAAGLKGLNPMPNVAGVCARCGQRHPSCCGLAAGLSGACPENTPGPAGSGSGPCNFRGRMIQVTLKSQLKTHLFSFS